MVSVQVREEHRIRPRDPPGRRRGLTAQVRDAIAQQRIGEQAHPVELDQHGRVPMNAIRSSGGAQAMRAYV